MFNYIKDVIINDVANTVVKVDDTLVVKRGANYKFDNIIDKKVYKTTGNAGTVGTLTIDTSKFTASGVDYRQYAIFVATPNQQLSDYALANWHEFGKPILIESGAGKNEADELAAAFKLALPNDNPFYTVSVSTNSVILTLAEPWMKFTEAKVFEHFSETNTLTELTTANTTVIVSNVEEFGTAKWLVENLRFPSYPNLRYNRLYADEAPVAGTIYDQYAFQYGVKHYIDGGLSGVGQNVDSITTHVFYVPHAQASTFEGKFSGIEFVTDKSVVSSMNVYANDNAAVSAAAASAASVASAAAVSGSSESAPTTSTVGKVGDTLIYNGDVYTCTAVTPADGDTPASYTWVKTFDHTA